ncbi:MAG: hypothetical protein ACE5FH_13380 [Candidatus Zixiibacteriota bacterium]
MQKWMTILVLLLAVTWCGRLSAQDKKPVSASDSTKSRNSGELILDEIQIEGVVEKPNVTILRNRLTSDFGAVEYEERTFDRELRALPDKHSLFDEEFESVKKVNNLKKVLKEVLQ